MDKSYYAKYFGHPNSAQEDKECLLFECVKPNQSFDQIDTQTHQNCETFETSSQQPITVTMLFHLIYFNLVPQGKSFNLKNLSEGEQKKILTATAFNCSGHHGLAIALEKGNPEVLTFYGNLFKSSTLDSATKKELLFAAWSDNDRKSGIYGAYYNDDPIAIRWYFQLLKDSLNNKDYIALMGELLNANVFNSDVTDCQYALKKDIATELFNNKKRLTADFFIKHLTAIGQSDLEVTEKKKIAKEFIKDFRFLKCLPDDEKQKLEGQIKKAAQSGPLQYLRQKTGILVDKSAQPVFSDDVKTYSEILSAMSGSQT